MSFADSELIAEFAIESNEGLANIEQQLLAIEARGRDIDVELVNSVFRTMHSIKGTAGFLGLNRIGALAHRLEEVLNFLRNREVIPTSELVTSVLKAADYMKGLIDEVESSNDADISPYVAELTKFRPSNALDTASAPAAAIDTPPAQQDAALEAGSPRLTEAVREFLVECHDNLDQMDQDLLALEKSPSSTELLRGIFRTMHTIKGGAGFLGLKSLERLAHTAENLLGQLRDGALQLSDRMAAALLATVDKSREGLRLVEARGNDEGLEPESVMQQLDAAASSTGDVKSKQSNSTPASAAPSQATATTVSHTAGGPVEPSTDAPTPSPTKAKAADTAVDKSTSPVSDTTIRVDVGLLDKLMTRVGELVLARNQILQRSNSSSDAEFTSTAQRLNLITTELQEGVMKTRMQPIGNVWSKFPRVVRDLSSQLGKQVRIEMEGKETELDKTIVEAIKDPLTHLVRNSVDHGIEPPAVRTAVGKPAEGTLVLRAYHEGGQVNIEIVDDGGGLNLERIRKKAVERGMMTAEQASRLSDRDASLLIFAPGFSTAEQVTSVSGRGVGMDVVRTNIEKIGGTIDLQSRPGAGTTIKIKIPLTLAIIPALVVTNDGDRYAIPQVSLLELVRLDGDEARRSIENVHGAPVYRLRGKLLPLVYLSERFGADRSHVDIRDAGEEHAAVNIVVLRADDRQFGLVVDKVNDTEEIVVKPLGKQLKGIAEYAGATIMGDGDVALILDVKGLAVAAGLGTESRERAPAHDERDGSGVAAVRSTLLVVDLGDERRFALPTSMVARLEKIRASTVEQTNGREVIQYCDAILPLVRLIDVFGGRKSDASDELQVVVYDERDHSFGLVVERIVDITEAELNFRSGHDSGDYLLGTTIVQQRVTDVLDLRSLARFDRSPTVRPHAN